MERWLDRNASHFYSLLRLMAGVMFAMHGAQKIFGAFGGRRVTGDPLMTLAGVIELVAGTLIAVGLLVRPAAILASGEMAVAYFKAHAPQGFLPIVNRGELAVLYSFLFLFFAAYGAGSLSLLRLLRPRPRTAGSEPLPAS